ncbi:hypothetical protein TW95_gp1208 [Pandoravirus inopinatum]|uniref:DUF5878 domain-containing protein n=1 Tax=Pandoravirus inopinatum TaxID=1605721 RepID=A0A0B5JDW5_9VIRU|nr:hypothetical protein TW95_gp1208 [Pandoravirus inopinatum]AJF97942.1 hypothetical protein [Pandoravirus inopinatum]
MWRGSRYGGGPIVSPTDVKDKKEKTAPTLSLRPTGSRLCIDNFIQKKKENKATTSTMEGTGEKCLTVIEPDERADQFVARVCEAMDRGQLRVRVRMEVPDDEDPDEVFGPIGKRLVLEHGVLSVHAVSTRPLIYEVGPRAIDVWGPAIEEAICAHRGGCALIIDPLSIYQRTAKQWRNLSRLSPLSMTPEESRLFPHVIAKVAARHDLQTLPTDDDCVWLFGAGV